MTKEPPFVLSVPGNGTRFTLGLLERNRGYNHVDQKNCDQRVLQREFVLVPLRRPDRVWQSWYSRDPRIDRFDVMLAQYRMLDQFSRQRGDICYFPIDHPDREVFLSDLRDRTGQDLRTDWGRVGHEDGPAAPAVDLSEIYAMPFLRRFYGDQAQRDAATNAVQRRGSGVRAP